MKKTLIALFALTRIASADVTQLTDLTKNITAADGLGYIYDAKTGLITDDSAIDGTLLNSYTDHNGYDMIQTAISFTLNLTEARGIKDSSKINILTINTSNVTNNAKTAGNIGLGLTSTGLCTTWQTSTFRNYSTSYEELLSDDSVFVGSDGNKYITLTMVYYYTEHTRVYDSDSRIIYDSGLRSDGNTNIVSVYVDKAYVDGVQFAPGVYTTDVTKDVNVYTITNNFNDTMKSKLVPEPTTATLSLLALAGLAARRRRR